MKQLYILVLLLAASCPGALGAEKQTSYLPSIDFRSERVVKNGREVELSMQVDLSRAQIRTQHTVSLTPVLVSADGSREVAFPPIVVDGGTRNKVYLRAQQLESVEMPPLHDDDAQVIIRRRNGSEQQYDYFAVKPYERWMLDGRVELREEVHGCVNCGEGSSEQPLLASVLPTYVATYATSRVEPEPEPVKVRAETRTARLQFRQDSYKILPDFKNNRAELDAVTSSIELVKQNRDVEITGIYITGYASPEGTEAYNKRLSQNRADALAAYARKDTKLPASLWHVVGMGEDWVGLREEVLKHPKLLKIDEVLAIIDGCKGDGDRDACEQRIKALVPPDIYQRLLNEMYGPLRRNEYRIEYNVRNFDLDEARKMIRERPDLLSLQEMYKVAGSYGKGTEGYEEAMRIAAEYYPESPSVRNDRAHDAFDRGDYAAAIALLEGAEDPVLLNTLGVAYARSGEPLKAEEAFAKAAAAGNDQARKNLEEVRGVIDQL